MATSAFKSTTKRASIGGSSSEDSSSASRSLRRSRRVSRFSRPIDCERDEMPDCNKNVSRGKVVNSSRELTAQFAEISLDDLALSSSSYENGSNSGIGERKEREWRSETGRWASDTASSRRRGRSVSRTPGDASSSSASRNKNVSSSDAGQRRRRSLSVTRYPVSDYEREVDHSRKSSNSANVKDPISRNGERTSAPKAVASSNRQLRRSQSHKDFSMLLDGYTSHSSALTDDESKDTRLGKHRWEKTIWPVYAQKKAMDRNQTALNGSHCLQSDNTEAFQDLSRIKKNYSSRSEQLEKHKQYLLAGLLPGDQRARRVSKVVKELPDSRTSTVAEKPSRARKRSSDRHRMSKKLTEGAEKYFEDFVSNIEDTDISSFDGERSDGSSTLGGTFRPRDPMVRAAETKSPAGSTYSPGEMDGVTLPWLQWEIGHGSPVSAKTKAHTPVTPKALQWDPEKGMVSLDDSSNHSTSGFGSWSPGFFSSPADKRAARSETRQLGDDRKPCYDLDEYLKLRDNEELLFEMYREQNRINSGGLLLCAVVL